MAYRCPKCEKVRGKGPIKSRKYCQSCRKTIGKFGGQYEDLRIMMSTGTNLVKGHSVWFQGS